MYYFKCLLGEQVFEPKQGKTMQGDTNNFVAYMLLCWKRRTRLFAWLIDRITFLCTYYVKMKPYTVQFDFSEGFVDLIGINWH